MKSETHPVPRTRIASMDVYAVAGSKHHVCGLLEVDVTGVRERLRILRRKGQSITLNGWVLKALANCLERHGGVAAFLKSKRKTITFDEVRISMMVEKVRKGERVPIPLLIKEANRKTAEQITREIEEAREQVFSERDVVLKRGSKWYERLYFHLPGFARRGALKFLVRRPEMAFSMMGNAVVTSLGMMGQVPGWFIHKTVHPLSLGLGSVIRKPVIRDNEIGIGEILHVTLLLDHDVVDGAPMARFVLDLVREIETGLQKNES